MLSKEKISTFQLATILTAFVVGDFILLIPPKILRQNAWFPVILSTLGGILLISLYVCISKLNPNRTLVGILYSCFGKFLGTLMTILYINYFLQLSAIILRTIGDYLIIVNYPQTPLYFILILIVIVMSYDVRQGIEVMGRLGEITVPLLFTFILLSIILVIPKFEYTNIYPIMEDGIKPILRESFIAVTFPFGESVVFLMVFPFLNDKKKLLKTSIFSVLLAGIILFLVTIQAVLILGPNLLERTAYPTHTLFTLVPNLILEPIVAINLLISGGAQIVILFFGAVLGMSQLFKLDDYKPIVYPTALFLVPFSIWFYDSTPEMTHISTEVLPYYSLFFQVVIPLVLLIISLIKVKLKKSVS